MLRRTDKFNKYIEDVTQDFIGRTGSSFVYLEKNRRKKMKIGIVALVKLYKGMELTGTEKELLDRYEFEDDYHTELPKCICFLAMNIARDTLQEVNKLYFPEFRSDREFFRGRIGERWPSDSYKKYYERLEEYRMSMICSRPYNLISLRDEVTFKHIKPTIDFDNECFVSALGNENVSVKKRTKTPFIRRFLFK